MANEEQHDLKRVALTPTMFQALMSSKKPIRAHVVVDGLKKTKESVVSRDIAAVEKCTTFSTIVEALERSRVRWLRSGMITEFHYDFEPAADAGPDDVIVVLRLAEVPASQEIGVFTSHSAVPELRANLVNIFGRGYGLQAQYTPPAGNSHAWSVKAVSHTPPLGLGHRLELSIGQEKQSYAFHPADAEIIEEAKVTVDYHTRRTFQSFIGGFSRRKLLAAESYGFPAVITDEFTTTVKAFVRHEWRFLNTVTHFNPRLFHMYPLPVAGQDLHLVNEFSGGPLGGDVASLRHELHAMQHILIHPLLSLDIGLRLGAVWGFGGDTARRRVRLNDRLFLGWRHIRGYRTVGPNTLSPEFHSDDASRDAVTRLAACGGNALWALSATLNLPFPLLPDNGFVSTHLFANAGNLKLFHTVSDFSSQWQDFFLNPAMSVGAGLVITRLPLLGSLPSGRLEVNFALPIVRDGITGSWKTTPADSRFFDQVKFGLVWSSTVSH